jgi:hypothetical protein
MRKIYLTKGKFTIVDDEDFEWINQWKWCATLSGYAKRTIWINGKHKDVFMHRLIMSTPKGLEIDHLNLDKLDNRKENLRNCTHSQNMQNRKVTKNNKLGIKGISLSQHKWRSRINVNNKNILLGSFEKMEDAMEAYRIGVKKYYGEHGRI